MGNLYIRDSSTIDDLIYELNWIEQHELIVGFVDYETEYQLMVAVAHEFGMTIKSENATGLAIPLPGTSSDAIPEDFVDLVLIEGSGDIPALLAEDIAGELVYRFILVECIDIPEKSFIRSTFDEEESKLIKMFEEGIEKVCQGKRTGIEVFRLIGEYLVEKIKKKIINIKESPNISYIINGQEIQNPFANIDHLIDMITSEIVSL